METKPGYKTTQFWLSLFAMIIGAIMSSGLLDNPEAPQIVKQVIGIIATVLGALGYTVARTFNDHSIRKAMVLGQVNGNGEKPNP